QYQQLHLTLTILKKLRQARRLSRSSEAQTSCYFAALRITTAEISFKLTKPSKNSAPVRWERSTRLTLTCSTLPPIFSPEFKRNSTLLPVLPCRMLRIVAFGCRVAFS